jgi:hypothetical protein
MPSTLSDFASWDVEVGQLIFYRCEKVTIEAKEATVGWWAKSIQVSAVKSSE